MSVDFSETLLVGISSRALLDLGRENEVFEEQDLAAYRSSNLHSAPLSPYAGGIFQRRRYKQPARRMSS